MKDMPATQVSLREQNEKLISRIEALETGISLPLGSPVKAKPMTGIEAPEGRNYPVLIQLDYASRLTDDQKYSGSVRLHSVKSRH
jgi:hypothetical protein